MWIASTACPLSRIAIAAAILLLPLAACVGGPGTIDLGPAVGDRGLRVLFVGNSLTYTNDLPAQVAMLARASGQSLIYETIAGPDTSLEDHVNAGLDEVIRDFRPDAVILQQGPSSLPESREHLVRWSRRIAKTVRETGGRTALCMVWPSRSRIGAFDDVRASYAAAAEAIDGLFIPAGDTWRAAWRRDSALDLYGPDGFHPSRLGSLAAALTIHAVLFESDPAAASCPMPDGEAVPAEVMATLCDAVRESIGGGAEARQRRPHTTTEQPAGPN